MPSPRLPAREDFSRSIILDIAPPSTGSPVNVLVLLHGLGDVKDAFTRLAKNLNLPETACISLQGFNPIPSIFTGSDSPSFHWAADVVVDERKGEIDLDGGGFSSSSNTLWSNVVDILISKCHYPARNILFLGYGQGAMLPLYLAGSRPDLEFGGLISIGGRLPLDSPPPQEAKCQTPVLVCAGGRSTQVTRSAVDALRSTFTNVEYVKWGKAEDSMPASREEMLPIMKFLARRLRSQVGVPEGVFEV